MRKSPLSVGLTKLSSEPLVLDKELVRVVEPLGSGAIVTLEDGTQHHVTESVERVLELLKSHHGENQK